MSEQTAIDFIVLVIMSAMVYATVEHTSWLRGRAWVVTLVFMCAFLLGVRYMLHATTGIAFP